MSAVRESPVVIPLPEPTGRRLRLGPFPSAREALRFVTYAAVGGVVAGLLGPVVWVPFVGGGFVLSVYQPEGRALDARFADYCRWRFRSRGVGSAPEVLVRGATLRLSSGTYLAAVAAAGSPVAFLPPEDARRRFERYRELLRSTEEGLWMRVGVEPLSPLPFLVPTAPASERSDAAARAGYHELVRLLCRRRFVRRVDVFLMAGGRAADALPRLEARVAGFRRALEELGVPARRLRGRELATAAARLGFRPPGEGVP